MVSINWREIRPHNNSQYCAFEELICQLARNEEIPNKASFIRKGTPDGGVEAYCVLENGDEYGWQAKFFHKMDQSEWGQIKDSFKTALEKHPKLVKYYVCIPLDRADARIPRRKSFMEKWDSFVKDMQEFAKKSGRNIEFEYWGSSELHDRLLRPNNAGKIKYFFGQNEFSFEWLVDKCNESINALDKRYTPELNFELEIAKMFNVLAFDEIFKKELKNSLNDLLQSANKCLSSFKDSILSNDCSLIKESIDKIKVLFNHINSSSIIDQELITLTQTIKKLFEIINKIDGYLYILEPDESDDYSIDPKQYDYQKLLIRIFRKSYYPFIRKFNEVTTSLINKKVLFLNGEAGSGKSHLLADITKKRLEDNKPTLFLLGEFFTSEDNPWTQIFRNIIRLENLSESEFLGALDSIAESCGLRLLIIIDAINEGKGIFFWNSYLKSFITKISSYNHLGLALSYRTSYQESLIPKSFLKEYGNNFITHKGFDIEVDEAIKLFFKYYNIEYPNVPLLNPEFSNPLFLKLFCEGLNKDERKKIPEGYSGISDVLKFYIKEKNSKLSNVKYLDYDPNINLVQKAIVFFINELLDKNTLFLMYDDVQSLFAKELGSISNSNKILQHLISEGIFSKNIYYENTVEKVDIVRLTYQRFEDHLITSYIINRYLNKIVPTEWFKTEGYLHKLINDENSIFTNSGLIEALSIQIPEATKFELYELIPQYKGHTIIVSAFLNSLIWRKPESIKEKTKDYIKSIQNLQWSYLGEFFNILFLVGSNPKHPYNADTLHNYLISFNLPERDALWIPIIQDNFNNEGNVYRLIDWNLKTAYFQQLNKESKLLTCKLLSWLLASSNRKLRDTTTKALIKSINSDFLLLINVLEAFSNIDDPYILERLYCVGYGCALRAEITDGLENLCNYIFTNIFDQDEVYPNILLRDYAKGIIEKAIYLGVQLKFNIKKTQPPYNSKLPNVLPTNDEIDSQYKLVNISSESKHYYSQNKILDSMTTEHGRGISMYGDFGRYIFQSRLSKWDQIDVDRLSNWCVNRIFELGYNVEKHGHFDRNQSHSRNIHGNERIGKKYQWIAFYEILARVADNKKLKQKNYKFKGPWEPFIRNIDPSNLLTKTNADEYETKTNNWWCQHSNIDLGENFAEWIKSENDIPNPDTLINLRMENKDEWLNLVLHTNWNDEIYFEDDNSELPKKQLNFSFSCFLIPVQYTKLIKSLKSVPQSILELSSIYKEQDEIFAREYYTGVAYKDLSPNKKSHDLKIPICIQETKFQAYIPFEYYFWNGSYDYSKEDKISYFIPSSLLFNNMGMRFSSIDGKFNDPEGNLLCFDPSIYQEGPRSLLVKKSNFLNFLKTTKLNAVWLINGKKEQISENHNRRDFSYLDISGLYYLENGNVEGKIFTKFIPCYI